jgi:hypothetical protein
MVLLELLLVIRPTSASETERTPGAAAISSRIREMVATRLSRS